jgi:hypothetical protein
MPRKKAPRGVQMLLEETPDPVSGSPLTVSDVCAILKACRQNRVVRFEWRGLELMLEVAPGEDVPVWPKVRGGNSVKAQKAVEAEEERGLKQKELRLREDQLDQLAIEDPMAYERFMLEDAEKADSASQEDDEP